MSFNADAISKACARLSNAHGPAIKASGSALPNLTSPTATVVFGFAVIRTRAGNHETRNEPGQPAGSNTCVAPIAVSGPITSHCIGSVKSTLPACRTARAVAISRTVTRSDLGFEERISWVDQDIGTIRCVAEAVKNGEHISAIAWALPRKEKKPHEFKNHWQFIAACVELIQAIDAGPSFPTRLPLLFDGCCSGMQHFAAMTRAREGRYVNFVPSLHGDDFYRRVAFETYLRDLELEPHLMGDKPFDRSVLYRAASYELARRGAKGKVARPIPTVQRPGSPVARAPDEDIHMRSLENKLNTSMSVRDAANLVIARRNARRR